MTPIDDELRSLLQSRATSVSPAPDPLGGIESRARGLRRRRALAAASSAAVVVAAIAVAVPLVSSGGGTTVRQPIASAPPVANALDPAHPWALRGDTVSSTARDNCQCSPLFTRGDGAFQDVFGVSTNPAKPGLVFYKNPGVLKPMVQPIISELPADRRVLTWIRGGTLVVVAAPGSTVSYAADGTSFQTISGNPSIGAGEAPIAPGVTVDRIRVTEADGTTVVQDAPDWHSTNGTPDNLLTTWTHRGDNPKLSAASVAKKFEAAMGATGGGHYRSLYDGTSKGLDVTIGQAWLEGDAAAHTVALDSTGDFFLGPETPVEPWIVAANFAGTNGKDLLVLLPRPGAGRIGYSPTATGAFTDVANGRSDLNPVGLVDRDPMASNDRVQVHRGDDSVILTEAIGKLTCGDKECG